MPLSSATMLVVLLLLLRTTTWSPLKLASLQGKNLDLLSLGHASDFVSKSLYECCELIRRMAFGAVNVQVFFCTWRRQR